MARLEQCATHIRIQIEPADLVLEIGRQSKDDPPPLAVVSHPECLRLVIANREQTEIGRRQLRIEVTAPRRVKLTNINDNNQITLPTGKDMGPGATFESSLPVRIHRGSVQLSIELLGEVTGAADGSDAFHSFAIATQSPSAVSKLKDRILSTAFAKKNTSESFVGSIQNSHPDAMLDRLGQLITVMQRVASTTDFAEQIAKTTVDLVNLDHAAILVREGQSWKVSALADQKAVGPNPAWQPSQSLLNQLLQEKKTFWGRPGGMNVNRTESLAVLLAMVAAPILNPAGDVIGAVYGDRRIGGPTDRPPIDHLDAKLVEIMACGVAGGWARIEHEQIAVARRVQLERFVTKEVARTLEEDPNALAGRDADVTLLFCDIAGFSRISEQLSPPDTFKWINAVMETLSSCVLATNGTLIDYVGDELIAMWGAPIPITDHANAAAQTAVLMMNALRQLNERYPLPGGATTEVGIGLNSGKVSVGNTGTEHKLKYGPLGSEVNIASRVQGATRYLRTPALITGATARQLDGKYCTRRLCSVRLKNIETPVELHELVADPGPNWNQLAADYEQALQAWEQRDLPLTIEILSQLIAKNKKDGPTMVLLSRAVDVWARGQLEYDPVWTLPAK